MMNGTSTTRIPQADKPAQETTPAYGFLSPSDTSQEQVVRGLDRIFSAGQPGVVFGTPVVSGEYTVIPVSSVLIAGGFGSGKGFGPSPGPGMHSNEVEPIIAGGTGNGMGGTSIGRPVSVIVIGPQGVEIKPVVDVTRVILAAIAAWSALSLIFRAMFKARKPAK